ncbi:MAG: hypothetical protein NVS2B7_35520 [Herpetosiphon sp.]
MNQEAVITHRPGARINTLPSQRGAQVALTLLRLTLGVLFVWVFLENRKKGLYTPGGYAGLINNYVKNGHAPAAWKSIMRITAANARITAPLQGVAELTFGILLLLGGLTKPVGLAAFAFLTSLWVSELGTAWIWELLVPMLVALSLAVGGAGREFGLDGLLRNSLRTSAEKGSIFARFIYVLT